MVRTALHECTTRFPQEAIVSTCVLMKRQPLTTTISLLAVEGLIAILRLTAIKSVDRLWPGLYTATIELHLPSSEKCNKITVASIDKYVFNKVEDDMDQKFYSGFVKYGKVKDGMS